MFHLQTKKNPALAFLFSDSGSTIDINLNRYIYQIDTSSIIIIKNGQEI